VKPLVTRPISWIDQAAVSARGTGTTSASPSEVFAVLADHERWPEWFGNVKKVEVLGPATGVGARRRVTVPGLVVDEEFIVWDEGERWSFTATAARPALFSSLVEDCVLTARPDGGTDISYTMYFQPKALAAPFMKLGAGMLRKTIDSAMRGLAARAEGRP
jgi:uncharacterized protein YndB with AHSA1/START domain